MKLRTIISFYDRRPVEPLELLLRSLTAHEGGAPFSTLVVVNSTGNFRLPPHICSQVDEVLYRQNLGMNIGAWEEGRQRYGAGEILLFLQDECFAVRRGWAAKFLEEAGDERVGLVGESVNANWDRPWEQLRREQGGNPLPEHFLSGAPANRVDVYLDMMRRHNIDPGTSGLHVRSLAWAARSNVLSDIGGFPIGANYGECIGAEIAVSRAIASQGLQLKTVGALPFEYFRHREWNQDVPGGPFSHRAVLLDEVKRLREENAMLRSRLGSSRSEAPASRFPLMRWWRRS
jgi:hypothetical protein